MRRMMWMTAAAAVALTVGAGAQRAVTPAAAPGLWQVGTCYQSMTSEGRIVFRVLAVSGAWVRSLSPTTTVGGEPIGSSWINTQQLATVREVSRESTTADATSCYRRQ